MLDAAVFLGTAGGLDGVASAGAVDQDPLLADGGTGLGKTGIDRFIVGDVDVAEHAADFGRHGFALLGVHVENGDLDALACQQPRRGGAQARCTAGNNRRTTFQIHVNLPMFEM